MRTKRLQRLFFLLILVSGGTDPRVQKKLLHVFKEISAADTAIVRMVQKISHAIQCHFEARTMRWLDVRSQMVEQGFHFAPMDIGAELILQDGAQQVNVFVAHGDPN
jgi:hypothetical protein